MSSLPATPGWPLDHPDVPHIADDDDFSDLVKKLSFYFTDAIELPHSFEDLRSLPSGRILNPLISYLSDSVHHPAIVSALLALKAHFSALEETNDEPGINEARGYACEFVAWQFLANLSERESIDFLLYELPSPSSSTSSPASERLQNGSHAVTSAAQATAETPLLASSQYLHASSYFGTDSVDVATSRAGRPDHFSSQFVNLSALEIASVSGAKKFLSQRAVQKIINGIWRGDIVLWESLSVNSVKSPKLYNRKRADPFCRLRVPRYLKVFETLFFAAFLALYFIVLVERNFDHVTTAEVLLFVWITGFAYDELATMYDAEQTSFYTADFWWVWDISIVLVGTIFFVLRIVGLTKSSENIIDLSYDVLGLEALFLVPRICSLLSLNPYFGTLIPCLKEMTKDFVKFLSLIIILYLGFLTTFTLLARDQFTPREMSWILVKVFFGSSYLGFDVAQEISPYFGPAVMLVFVALTNILLITSLISLLSNSLAKVLDHAREEYLFLYSVYVLEASASNRLTYFVPPLNLIPLFLRPLRLILPSEQVRSARIVLLKATHAPLVGAIWLYELVCARNPRASTASIHGPETSSVTKRPLRSSANSPHPTAPGVQASQVTDGNMASRSIAPAPNQATESREPDQQLGELVTKLALQVEQLTAVVAQLQQQQRAVGQTG